MPISMMMIITIINRLPDDAATGPQPTTLVGDTTGVTTFRLRLWRTGAGLPAHYHHSHEIEVNDTRNITAQ